MAKRYRSGLLRRMESPLAAFVQEKTTAYNAAMKSYQVQASIEAAMEIVTRCNAYVEETAPWKLSKDPAQAEKLDEVLYTLSESLRIISILMSPIIPREADAIRAQLNWQGDASFSAATWGVLPEGHQLGEPVPLFPRIEPQECNQ
jgi:methionyl-tRNA synthetase